MARKKLPPSKKLADICKIHPERFRAMRTEELQKVDPSFIFYKDKKPRTLTIRLVRALIAERTTVPLSARSAEAYRRNYKAEPPDTAKIRAMYVGMAADAERKIWAAQAKAGCRLEEHELVARDADLENKTEVAARLRAEAAARRRRTPHRRPAKIR